MVLLPQFRIIFNVIRLTYSAEKTEIIDFEILFSPVISQEYQIIAAASPDFIVSGSKAVLYWKVKGVSRIDLTPLGRDIRGNAAEVVITPLNREFTLTVYGLSGKVSSTISIPAENIKTLENHKVSENESLSASYLFPKTEEIEPKITKLEVQNVKSHTFLIKKTKQPFNHKITASHKKESAYFKANYSLSKYNLILTEQNSDKL